jgi:hypothetical protein
MSEITLFNQDLPDYLKDVELDAVTKALVGNGGSKRISLRGGKFRMVVNGEEILTSNSDTLNVVIVNAAKDVSRTFYEGVYNPKEKAGPPDCWSADGVTPDASIQEPQHHNCGECPQNVKGSGQGGGRACRHFRRIAVALADDIGGDIYQLTLASKSIFGKGDLNHMPFEQYAKYVGSQGYNLNTLSTEMRFDEDSDTAKLYFKPLKFLSKEQWETAKKQGATPAAVKAVEMSVPKNPTGENAPKLVAPAHIPKNVPQVEEAAPEVAEPKKRVEKKAAEPTPKKDLKAIMGDWGKEPA